MTNLPHTNMHNDHRLWESEISLWRDDLRSWQQELAKAQGQVKNLEKALEEHAHILRTHASTLRLEEQISDAHEHALADFEKGGEGEELLEMSRQHREEAGRHAEHRAAHEHLKRLHHSILAHWNLLLKALSAPAD